MLLLSALALTANSAIILAALIGAAATLFAPILLEWYRERKR